MHSCYDTVRMNFRAKQCSVRDRSLQHMLCEAIPCAPGNPRLEALRASGEPPEAGTQQRQCFTTSQDESELPLPHHFNNINLDLDWKGTLYIYMMTVPHDHRSRGPGGSVCRDDCVPRRVTIF